MTVSKNACGNKQSCQLKCLSVIWFLSANRHLMLLNFSVNCVLLMGPMVVSEGKVKWWHCEFTESYTNVHDGKRSERHSIQMDNLVEQHKIYCKRKLILYNQCLAIQFKKCCRIQYTEFLLKIQAIYTAWKLDFENANWCTQKRIIMSTCVFLNCFEKGEFFLHLDWWWNMDLLPRK